MSGARYADWTFVRVVGDRAAAQPILPYARKLLGAVMEDAARNKLGVHSMRRELEDGSVVVAEKIGDLPRITITPAPRPSQEPPKTPASDFVVWARNGTLDEGIDSEFPQQILQKTKAGWKTFFYDSSVTGYADFTLAKGTYSNSFGDGIRHAGNIDWVSRKDLRISWYGPSSRYWPDAYVQPRSQYGKFVFMLGAVLLDTDAYATASTDQAHGDDRYVLGAALKKVGTAMWLYTVQSEATAEPSPTLSTSRSTTQRPYSQTNMDGGMYRYQLYREVDTFGVTRYKVDNNSRELLFTYNNHAEPWFFNVSCTAAHCYELPPTWYAATTTPYNPTNPDAIPILPNGTQIFQSATIGDDTADLDAATTLSVTANNAWVPFASDYVGDTRKDMTLQWKSGVLDAWFKFDEVAHPIKSFTNLVPTGPDTAHDGWDMGCIAYANIRDNVLVFRRDHHLLNVHFLDHSQDEVLGTGQTIEVWRGGAVEHVETIAPDSLDIADFVYSSPGMGKSNDTNNFYMSQFAGNTLPPYFFVYGLIDNLVPVGPGDSLYAVNSQQYGCNTGLSWAPYPAAAYFGTFYASASPDSTGAAFSSFVYNAFQGNRVDFDGHYSTLTCATTEEIVMLSMWRPVEGSGAQSFHYVSDAELPNLTGVAGANNRYHPVWLMGKPPATV